MENKNKSQAEVHNTSQADVNNNNNSQADVHNHNNQDSYMQRCMSVMNQNTSPIRMSVINQNTLPILAMQPTYRPNPQTHTQQ